MATVASTSRKLAVITGGGSGIGAALALALARPRIPTHTHTHTEYHVMIVGRRAEALEAVAAKAPQGSMTCVSADITTEAGIAAVASAVAHAHTHTHTPLHLLVHNAGVLGPIEHVLKVPLDEWRSVFETNVHAPLALTQALASMLSPGARILNVSSGAANSAMVGWSAYCCSKAALSMLWRVMREELRAAGVAVGSVRPGVVDTPMQGHIRTAGASTDAFPSREKFVKLFERRAARVEGGGASEDGAPPPADALDSPENVAVFMRWLLTETSAEEFSAAEWDIRDSSHHARWARK